MPKEIISCPKCESILVYETLYTQAELDAIIGDYANTKLYQAGYKAGVKAENEACAVECDKRRDRYIYSDPYDSDSEQEAIELCAEAIRARNK